MDKILNALPKEEITEKFKFGLESALIHCCIYRSLNLETIS
ncbi:hypothetical protein ORQ95_14020 [Leptospira kirschneri]|nr:hypothetical protein [Leptospira kirschneri]EMJ85447.1 hypothetical protein LEP1GSC198_0062 [Leptospira kirschneri str. JB]EMN23834.1 hypothetical protein LEP1GSC065_0471 [Leptospira kirschneri serovar Sokoine str. RM1]EPG48959.1 hypothetical protein LEP1GSC049_1217 [Leptospira kirschneri serovar Cynopteri str. 3522 CT]UZW37787.1 hypothetical protein ORQ95_14020 [Leptospira kirschneri]WHP01487.1 hypothetical protein QMK36_14030 [Leptospira kirschneri]